MDTLVPSITSTFCWNYLEVVFELGFHFQKYSYLECVICDQKNGRPGDVTNTYPSYDAENVFLSVKNGHV